MAATSGIADGDPLRPTGQVGTIDTVAGPGYCEGPATVDPRSLEVRSVAVNQDSNIYFDTGPPADPVIGRISVTGEVEPVLLGQRARLPGQTETAPLRLAPDGAGGLLVAVSGVEILNVTGGGEDQPGGGVVVVAGQRAAPDSGRAGAGNGDGGPAVGARFGNVLAIASAPDGNVFAVDALAASDAVSVRVVNRGAEPRTYYAGTPQELTVAPASIATVAGGGPEGGRAGTGSIEGRPAREAVLRGGTPAVAVTGDRLYVVTATRSGTGERVARVQLVNLSSEPIAAHGVTVAPGIVETVAGGGDGGPTSESASARDAALPVPAGMGVDSEGNLYLADEENHRVLRVDAQGTLSVFVGGQGRGGGFNGNGGPAVEAQLDHPVDVEPGLNGRVYVADRDNGELRFVDPTGRIQAAPGRGVGSRWVCGGAAGDGVSVDQPRQAGPLNLAADPAGNVYFDLAGVSAVKRIEPSGAVVTAVSSETQPEVAVGPGGVYLVESQRSVIRFANLGTRPANVHGTTAPPGPPVTVAGTGVRGEGGDGTAAVTTPVSLPVDPAVAADGGGGLFFTEQVIRADAGGSSVTRFRIRFLDSSGALTTVVADHDVPRPTKDSPPPPCCSDPQGLAVDLAGNLYVADAANFRVWYLNRGGQAAAVHGQSVAPGAIVPVAGNGLSGFEGDGDLAVNARLQTPGGVAVDRAGNLYVADDTESTVRRVDNAGIITTIAGTGESGFNGDGREARLTALASPGGLAVDGCGNLLIADFGNNRVRRLNLVPPCRRPEQAAPPPVNEDNDGGGLPMTVVAPVVGLAVGVGAAVAVVATRRRRS